MMTPFALRATISSAFILVALAAAPAQVLDKQKLLDRETFWDNRDPRPARLAE